nr:immunoglobulin light chain junction region [Macaca mulatta]MPO06989.1 immunoglobulin light chain junction region [Macaca mulatta]MPO08609.1 immunoglobulin light chain junction region [Macaca mulatta]MPO11374.1 immunoglobulin light chain junction region [Macaca mulatta]
CVIWHNNAYIF